MYMVYHSLSQKWAIECIEQQRSFNYDNCFALSLQCTLTPDFVFEIIRYKIRQSKTWSRQKSKIYKVTLASKVEWRILAY